MDKFYRKLGYIILKNIIHFVNYLIPFNSVRIMFLRIIGMKIGRKTYISNKIKLDFWWRIKIGNNCYINNNVYLDSRGNKILINDNVDISESSILYTLTHDIYSDNFKTKSGKIIIHDKVWICSRCIILPNSIIGESSVIGANTVYKGVLAPFTLIDNQFNTKKLPKNRSINVRK